MLRPYITHTLSLLSNTSLDWRSSKGTLVNFSKVLIVKGLNQRLIELTVEIAKNRGGFILGHLRQH
jgi:hypothetical protein